MDGVGSDGVGSAAARISRRASSRLDVLNIDS